MGCVNALRIIRAGTCVLVALGLLGAVSVASAATRGIVIGVPGTRGVELVGADHQARKLTTGHRSKLIRPGAVVHYTARTRLSLPVTFSTGIGHIKQTFVLGVVSGTAVRLADGRHLHGVPGVTTMKAGSSVTVTLTFAGGHMHVRSARARSARAQTWWHPTSAAPLTLHWVLDNPLNLNDPVQMGERSMSGATLPAPDVYDIDGFENSAATVAALHAMGKKVICYVDAGVYETYRPDADKFKALSPRIWGAADEGWAGSYWLDIRRISELAPIMQARFQMCKDKGFDAIEPDEITGWSNNSGFPLTYADQITYNRALAGWAHAIGMSIGLKGDIEQAHDLVGDFDWTLNEQCYEYSECTTVSNEGPGADGKDWPGVQLFSQAGKAVWIAEYKGLSASQCADAVANHFNASLYVSGLPLDGGRQPCTGTW
jgi:Glycoside-hydrolase family GH114